MATTGWERGCPVRLSGFSLQGLLDSCPLRDASRHLAPLYAPLLSSQPSDPLLLPCPPQPWARGPSHLKTQRSPGGLLDGRGRGRAEMLFSTMATRWQHRHQDAGLRLGLQRTPGPRAGGRGGSEPAGEWMTQNLGPRPRAAAALPSGYSGVSWTLPKALCPGRLESHDTELLACPWAVSCPLLFET